MLKECPNWCHSLAFLILYEVLTDLSIAFVKRSNSSIVPYASYVSSITVIVMISFIIIILVVEYWGSKNIANAQKQPSASLSLAYGSLLGTSNSFLHLWKPKQ